MGSVGLGDSARIERVFADFVVGTSFDFGKSRHRTRKFIFQRNAARGNAVCGAYRAAQNVGAACRTTFLTLRPKRKSKANIKKNFEYQDVFGGVPPLKIDGYVLLACVPTVAFAFLFKLLFPSLLDGKLLGCGFVLTSILLYLGENFHSTKSALLSPKISILTGVLQGIAVLPGVSRSGATISALTLQGIDKQAATTFSFLLSIPIIIGSALYESLDLISGKAAISISPWAIIVGMISAFLSGLLAIKFFLKLIQKHSITGFAVYTLLLGIAVSVYPFFL